MRSITFIIGPIIFLQIFRWSIDPKSQVHLPGAPYFLAAALLFTAMLMSTRIRQTPAVSTGDVETPPEIPPEITASGGAPINEIKEAI